MQRPSCDEGSTLIETLVAVSILGISFTAVIGGMYTSTLASDAHRKQASAATYLSSYAEAVKGDAYSSCASSYPGGSFTLPAGYLADPVVVAYWDTGTSSYVATCGTDSGLQRVTLGVRSADGRAVTSVHVVKRTP